MVLKFVLIALVIFGLFFSASSYNCPDLIKKYGNRISLPSIATSTFYGSTIGLEVSTSSGTVAANGKIGSYGIEKIACGSAMTDYTVYMKESAVNTLSKASSSARTNTFLSLMKKGDIKLTAHGYIQNMKLKMAMMFLGSN
jgi:hypothetical protein